MGVCWGVGVCAAGRLTTLSRARTRSRGDEWVGERPRMYLVRLRAGVGVRVRASFRVRVGVRVRVGIQLGLG